MEICYVGFENDYEIKVLKKLISKYKKYFPFWVYEIRFEKKFSNPDDVEIQLSLFPEYKKVIAEVYPIFFTYNSNKIEDIFTHELMHMILARLSSWVDNKICDSEDRQEEFRERLESTVQELTYIFRKVKK